MNWSVYGQVLANIPAPELVEGGYILILKTLNFLEGPKL